MSPLGNRLISKLNGLGNAIMVLDLRGQRAAVSGAEARAIHNAVAAGVLVVIAAGDDGQTTDPSGVGWPPQTIFPHSKINRLALRRQPSLLPVPAPIN